MSPVRAFCDDPRIDGLSVTHNEDVLLSFNVTDAFTKEIEEAIKTGIPVSFTFYVEVYRIRGLWFNESVGSLTYLHTVKYDSFSEEYSVSLDETSENPVLTKDTSEMMRLMVSSSNLPILRGVRLNAGDEYELRVMAELNPVTLPFYLDYMLFFVKFWDFETDWHYYRFVYKTP